MSLIPKAIEIGALRHQVLAGNIANAMTPNYRPKDVFIDLLDTQKRANGSLSITNAKHMNAGAMQSGQIGERELPLQPNADGSLVDVEVERAQMMNNANHLQGLTRAATYYLRVQQLSVS